MHYHMGQIPQVGENGQNVALFLFFWSFAVTKQFDFFNFSQVDDIGDDGDDDL